MSNDTTKFIGLVMLTVAGSALVGQLGYGKWEWQQQFDIRHHEGVTLAAGITGAILLFGSTH